LGSKHILKHSHFKVQKTVKKEKKRKKKKTIARAGDNQIQEDLQPGLRAKTHEPENVTERL